MSSSTHRRHPPLRRLVQVQSRAFSSLDVTSLDTRTMDHEDCDNDSAAGANAGRTLEQRNSHSLDIHPQESNGPPAPADLDYAGQRNGFGNGHDRRRRRCPRDGDDANRGGHSAIQKTILSAPKPAETPIQQHHSEYSQNDGKSGNHLYIKRRDARRLKLHTIRRCKTFDDSTVEECSTQANRKSAVAILHSVREDANDFEVRNRVIAELLKTERDYVADLELCVSVYLEEFREQLERRRQIETEADIVELKVFGNIERICHFHARIFLERLMLAQGSARTICECFTASADELRKLYVPYLENKERNNALLSTPDLSQIFSGIKARHGFAQSQDAQSLLIKPVQRIMRYALLLREMSTLPDTPSTSTSNADSAEKVEEQALAALRAIPRMANDRIHLRMFDAHARYGIGEFQLQDTFRVRTEPRVYFEKRERVLQAFLFESNILLAKLQTSENSAVPNRYVIRQQISLRNTELRSEQLATLAKRKGGGAKCFRLCTRSRHGEPLVVKFRTESAETCEFWIRAIQDLLLRRVNRLTEQRSPTVSNVRRVRTMSSDNFAGNPHPPLRRVLPRASVDESAFEHSSAHPLLFACNSLQQHYTTTTLAPPLSQQQQLVSPKSHGSLRDTTTPSLPDSCYSSCSEAETAAGGHLLLSREPSDSSSSASATAADEFHQRLQLANSSNSSSDGASPLASPFGGTVDDQLLGFATKLGYSEENLRVVLGKLGADAQQDRVLSELIKLRRCQSSGGGTDASGYGGQPQRRRTTGSPLSSEPSATMMNTAISTTTSTTEYIHHSSPTNTDQQNLPKLRPIVIDGSNVAMSHGAKEVFSCQGIRECVNFFVDRGHSDILVFVPQFRREKPRPDSPITDQHILFELEAEKRLIWTPSRRIGGRRIVCHDDRYIVKTADEKQAIVVSNDEYRDLCKESPTFRNVVEQFLLMYSFVDGKFMPPDDPLGRRGPKLDQFLSFGPALGNAQLCPYAKKCTYGNKCKYYHPERPNGVRLSVTDRLLKESGNGNNGARTSSKASVAARPSMIVEGRVRHSPPTQPKNSLNMPASHQQQQHHHGNVGRTQSLNLPTPNTTGNAAFTGGRHFGEDCPTPLGIASSAIGDEAVTPRNFSPLSVPNAFPFPPPPFRPQSHQQRPSASDRQNSTPPQSSSSIFQHPQQHFHQSLNSNPANFASHSPLNRIVSAPLQFPNYGGQNPEFHQQNHCQEQLDASLGGLLFSSTTLAPKQHMFVPSADIWGESEFSVGGQLMCTNRSNSNPTNLNEPSTMFNISNGGTTALDRQRLQYHLCQLFPESTVMAVLCSHPNEHDPQKLCQRILAFQKGFNEASAN